jgi:hypothetical protein
MLNQLNILGLSHVSQRHRNEQYFSQLGSMSFDSQNALRWNMETLIKVKKCLVFLNSLVIYRNASRLKYAGCTYIPVSYGYETRSSS